MSAQAIFWVLGVVIIILVVWKEVVRGMKNESSPQPSSSVDSPLDGDGTLGERARSYLAQKEKNNKEEKVSAAKKQLDENLTSICQSLGGKIEQAALREEPVFECQLYAWHVEYYQGECPCWELREIESHPVYQAIVNQARKYDVSLCLYEGETFLYIDVNHGDGRCKARGQLLRVDISKPFHE